MFVALIFALVFTSADARSIHERIIGGNDTTINEHPHQVSIHYYDNHICGGSIISDRHIITAAHCIQHKSETGIQVRIGSTIRNKDGEMYDVERMDVFPYFTASNMDVDIAFLILKDPIKFSDSAKPVTIAGKNDQPKHGDMLTVTGWGATQVCMQDLAYVLQVARLPTINIDACRKAYGSFKIKVTKNMICGGGSMKKSAFVGDSGGPALNDKNQLVGLVSWGCPLHPTGYPTVFTNLAATEVQDYINEFLNR